MVKPSRWPDAMEDTLWAKSPERGAGGHPESLARHTWDVLQRLAEFIALRPDLPQTLGLPRLWQVLFWAAFLHDFGKAAGGFQARLRGGAKWPYRHEVLSLAFVDWIAAEFTTEEQAWLVAAIVSHHKDAEEIQRLYPEPEPGDDDWLSELLIQIDPEALIALWDWLQGCAATWIMDLGLSRVGVTAPAIPAREVAIARIRMQGVTRIRHWLKVYRRFVRRLKDDPQQSEIIGALTLRGYLINADHSASAHAGALPRVHIAADTILQRMPDHPYAHQLEAGQTLGSALLVAPTGSGKTEAALLWAARQANHSARLPRLFYTLPYQASMNAMKLRLEDTFPGKGIVGLQHGRSLLSLYRMLLEEEDYTPETAARQSKWARNLAELNYPPIRIFSPYQMLKGMYRLRGYEALLADYHGAAFVFDEIHAYEVERLAMILTTMAFLSRAFDARFFVMSATFPTLVKTWLQEALGGPLAIKAADALFAAFCRHRLVLLEGEITTDDALERISQDALAGKSVLVTCNLVDRAQAMYRELRDRLRSAGVHVELLHGRFNMRDRSAKEQLVRNVVGARSEDRHPLVLVATQVVEVSLDIDLDTIYTDPAPLEALVQRFGRVNRRRKQSGLAPVHVYKQPADGQKIYDDELVKRTLAILERENGHPIDEAAIGHWLDEIYSGDIAATWQQRYRYAASEFEATCIQSLQPFAADRTLEELFYKAFDSIEILPQSLVGVYQQAMEEQPILAGEFLVSISWRRYFALRKKGSLQPQTGELPPVVHAAYSPEEGLVFEPNVT
ncbi:MAG: CRISPR-associated helicase Cas3' [Anaerolineae bacterium]|nr:CRISPR-associated helicase Cas3' [Anaerolineae bacterium]